MVPQMVSTYLNHSKKVWQFVLFSKILIPPQIYYYYYFPDENQIETFIFSFQSNSISLAYYLVNNLLPFHYPYFYLSKMIIVFVSSTVDYLSLWIVTNWFWVTFQLPWFIENCLLLRFHDVIDFCFLKVHGLCRFEPRCWFCKL